MSEMQTRKRADTALLYARPSPAVRSGVKLKRCIPVITIMGIIFYFSSQPGENIELPDIPNIDKYLHCLIYGVLALSACYSIPTLYLKTNPLRTCLQVVFFCLLYGISDEVHQSFVSMRTPSLLDLAADTFGAALSMMGVYTVNRWSTKK
jgi:VanZ family protein